MNINELRELSKQNSKNGKIESYIKWINARLQQGAKIGQTSQSGFHELMKLPIPDENLTKDIVEAFEKEGFRINCFGYDFRKLIISWG